MRAQEIKLLPCQGCGRKVTKASGAVVHVDWIAAGEQERDWRDKRHDCCDGDWELRAMSVTDLQELPERIRWRWHCVKCYLALETGREYWFDGDRIDTVAKALGWTLHMKDKGWFEHTNWEGFIRARVPRIDG